jgi:hypothetical protein
LNININKRLNISRSKGAKRLKTLKRYIFSFPINTDKLSAAKEVISVNGKRMK